MEKKIFALLFATALAGGMLMAGTAMALDPSAGAARVDLYIDANPPTDDTIPDRAIHGVHVIAGNAGKAKDPHGDTSHNNANVGDPNGPINN